MHRRSFLTGVAATTVGSTAIVSAKGGGKTHTVKMANKGSDYIFDPVGLYVEPGDTVKWVISSGTHTTTSYSKTNPKASNTLIPDGAKKWDSGDMSKGDKPFTYTFEKKGTYDYYCIPHKDLGMVGRIVCGEPGGPAEKQEIPNKPASGVIPPSKDIVKKKSLSYPYVPDTGHGGPPGLFWGGFGVFSLTSVYLFSVYDRKTGRYEQKSKAETILDSEPALNDDRDNSSDD